jgi:hypothetical protein
MISTNRQLLLAMPASLQDNAGAGCNPGGQREDDLLTRRFEVLESLCETGKANAQANEDRLVVTEDFAAVIDGSTSSGPIDGLAGGIVAAETVAATIRSLSAEATAQEFVTEATRRLNLRVGAFDRRLARPSAAAVVWSAARREVWRVGDCHFRIDEVEYNGDKPLDRLAYGFRCAVVRAELALGLTSLEEQLRLPVLEQAFRPLVVVQHAYANLAEDDPLAYGALDGRPVPARFIEVVEAKDAREIVLCSDGFPQPFADLGEGLRALARLKEADPLLIRDYLGSRPFAAGADYFDDTTYLRLKV